MSAGQCSFLDQAQSGLVSDFTAINSVVVAVATPLVGTLTLIDGDGTVKLSLSAGQSGAFTVAGPVYRMEYQLSNPADIGSVTVAFRPQ